MKKLISLLVSCALYLTLGAQNNNTKNLQIIYVDNYQSSIDPGLSQSALDSLHALISKVKSAQYSAYMFLTDASNSSETTNPSTMESLYLDINNHGHVGSPVNELNDIKQMRDGINERITHVSPTTISLNFFVSNDVLDMAINSSSFLINFFPRELAMSAPNAIITVNLYYSSQKRKSTQEKIEKSFAFLNTREFKSNIRFRAIQL